MPSALFFTVIVLTMLRSNYHFEKPFLWLSKKLTGYHFTLNLGLISRRNPQVQFAAEAALQPADFQMDPFIAQANKQAFREIKNVPLPELPPEEDL